MTLLGGMRKRLARLIYPEAFRPYVEICGEYGCWGGCGDPMHDMKAEIGRAMGLARFQHEQTVDVRYPGFDTP